jgi:predicted lipoprotein with Yx(FWY)xxD motif
MVTGGLDMPVSRTALVSVAAAALLVSCGSSAATGGGERDQPGNLALELHLHGVSGIGTVLTDPSGRALYTADQEARGLVKCTGACLRVFMPLLGTSVAAPSSVTSTTGTIRRPDTAQQQVTYKGAPLYTYVQDGAWGDAEGNGLHDTFGATHLTWHAVVVAQ